MNSIVKNLNKSIVLTNFNTHFQAVSRDWDNIEKYGNPYHPLWGYYKSDDRNILEKQLKAIKRATIDVIAYEVFGDYIWTPKDIAKDKSLPIIISMLEEQENNDHWLRYCIMYENYVGYLTFKELSYSISYAYKNLFSSKYYLKYNNKPVIFFFHDDLDPKLIKKLQKEYKDLEINQVNWSCKGDEGPLFFEDYPQTIRRDWMPVSPGFDSSLEEIYQRDMFLNTKDTDPDLNKLFKRYVQNPDWSVEEIREKPSLKSKEGRQNGLYYKKQLERAIKNNPKYIYISSWNDWQCQSQIEPAVEYGFKYVDMTAEILDKKDHAEIF